VSFALHIGIGLVPRCFESDGLGGAARAAARPCQAAAIRPFRKVRSATSAHGLWSFDSHRSHRSGLTPLHKADLDALPENDMNVHRRFDAVNRVTRPEVLSNQLSQKRTKLKTQACMQLPSSPCFPRTGALAAHHSEAPYSPLGKARLGIRQQRSTVDGTNRKSKQ
jgi:hypothetical protein